MFVVRLKDPSSEHLETLEAEAAPHAEIVRTVRLADDTFVLFRSEEAPDRWRDRLSSLPAVDSVHSVDTPYVLSSRVIRDQRTRLDIGKDVVIGSEEFVVMAGPCTVETETQVATIAHSVRASGARVLRGGAFKPRTSPFSFQGRGLEGLDILSHAGRKAGLLQVSEAMCEEEVGDVASAVDILQVGMRNGLNYSLLEAIGRHPDQPAVLLKRGIGSTIDEFLAAADYILAGGNPNVILCLRGTVDFSKHSRSSLNVADIPALRRLTHLPILVDPSHAAGHRDLVPAMSAAALVAGADGLLIEVHHEPDRAWVDGPQSLTLEGFSHLMNRLRLLAPAMGRWVAPGVVCETDSLHPMEELDLEKPSRDRGNDTAALQGHEELQA